MRLYISNSGIFDPVKYDLNDAINKLQNARYNIDSSPSDFRYASYVNNLGNIIFNYIKETQVIAEIAETTERRYNELFMDSKVNFQNINEFEVKERFGLSKIVDQDAKYSVYSDGVTANMKNIDKL